MIDWEGLLKFTLKYSDGTGESNFKQMKEQDKKWLEEAMQHYSNSEVKRIQQILEQLQNFNEIKEEQMLNLLQELQELLDSLDKGSTLYNLQGHIPLLKIIFYSKIESCRIIALQIYGAANQNDAKVQNQSINTGALEMVDLLRKETSMKMKQNLISAVSSTIRGENLEAKRIFIRLDGLQLLQQLLQGASQRLKYKINVLFRDLSYYNDKLHLTYSDLSSFSNTSALKVDNKGRQYDLKYDPNQEMKQINQLPENAKFRGLVHNFLQQRKQLWKNYLEWLKQRVKQQSADNQAITK